jgi:hypothetical protein
MSYSVNFESESIADLDNLTQVVRLRILNKIEWLRDILKVNLRGSACFQLSIRMTFYYIRRGHFMRNSLDD